MEPRPETKIWLAVNRSTFARS